MMLPTHVFVSLLLATPFAVLLPEHLAVIAASAIAGGIFPDLDILVGEHRRTLHWPYIGWLVAAPFIVKILFTAWVPPLAVIAAVFFACAAFHALVDIYACGPTMRPWQQDSEKGVYNWLGQTWVSPKYYIAYDGSPGDFILTLVLFLATWPIYSSLIWYPYGAGFLLLVAVVYVSIRKDVPRLLQQFSE